MCLHAVSKNLRGELLLIDSEREPCDDCVTLKTVHALRLDVAANPECDSGKGALLDGRFYSPDLTHAFADGDGNQRGHHVGTFRWRGQGVEVTGSMNGITNAGTHRQPVFEDCQPCRAHGFMEGSLCGVVRRSRDGSLCGCAVVGTYRLRFDPSSEGGQGAVRGTLEAVLSCRCQVSACVDFQAMQPGSGSNPRDEQGLRLEVFDGSGTPTPTTEIRTDGGFTGLHCGFSTRVTFPGGPAQAVQVTLVHLSQPATVQAFSGGVPGPSATMSGPQGQAETLSLAAPAIDEVVITAPQDETLLLRLCWQPA